MPKLSVLLIRASLLHLGTGFLFGALVLFQKGHPEIPWAWTLLLPHTEVLVFGWTMQFIMGVAFYTLPRFAVPSPGKYGAIALGWWSLVLINVGVVITAVGYVANVQVVTLAGRLFALSAVVLFVVMMWPRVKPFADGKIELPVRRPVQGDKQHE